MDSFGYFILIAGRNMIVAEQPWLFESLFVYSTGKIVLWSVPGNFTD